jgi:hypothetical protein
MRLQRQLARHRFRFLGRIRPVCATAALIVLFTRVPGPVAEDCADYGPQTRYIGDFYLWPPIEDLVSIGSRFFYTSNNQQFHVFDLPNPGRAPVPLAFVFLPQSFNYSIALLGDDFAYVAAYGCCGLEYWLPGAGSRELLGIRIDAWGAPALVGSWRFASDVLWVTAYGTHAYIHTLSESGQTGVAVLDVADPMEPRMAGFVETPRLFPTEVVDDRYLFATTPDSQLVALDVSDPTAPKTIPTPPFSAQSLGIRDHLLYCTAQLPGDAWQFCVLDFSVATPSRLPRVVGRTDAPVGGREPMQFRGQRAFYTSDTGVVVIDISSPASPTFFELLDHDRPSHLALIGENVISFSGRPRGIRVFELGNRPRVRPLARVARDDAFPGVGFFGLVDELAFVTCGGGSSAGICVYDVSDASRPRYLSRVLVDGDRNDESDCGLGPTQLLKHGDYGYMLEAAVDGSRLKVVDLSQPTAPVILGRVETPGIRLSGVVVSGSKVFSRGSECSAEEYDVLVMFDVSDKTAPRRLEVDVPRFERLTTFRAADSVVYTLGAHVEAGQELSAYQVDDASGALQLVRRVPAWFSSFQLYQDRAYVYRDGSMAVTDISGLLDPTDVFVPLPGGITGGVVRNGILYSGMGGLGVAACDISVLSQPRFLGRVGGGTFGAASGVAVTDKAVFAVEGRVVSTYPLPCLQVATPVSITDLLATGIQDGMLVTWTVVDGAFEHFYVERSLSGSADTDAEILNLRDPVPGSGPWAFLDRTAAPHKTYAYRLGAALGDGSIAWFGPIFATRGLASMSISAAWPNPASGVVQARLFLPTTNRVWASVFDVRGRHVRTIVDAPKPAGQHLLTWDGLDEDGFPAASGTYFLKLSTRGEQRTAKISMIRP